ncbi:MAG TPA: hypothetical protein VKE41_08425 [Roseiflexaceae bacterium]|nr:hypothetical protein [Roseiflexaceae bacterium]
MIFQNPDATIVEAPTRPSLQEGGGCRYRVEVSADLLDEQGSLIDWLIGFALDTLAAKHLDVRVRPTEY